MTKTIDYYLSPASPWTCLGHARLLDIAARHGAVVLAKPVDYGVIFPQSGGLPLPKRAPQRQAYRLVELARWKAFLGVPLVIQPKYFPVDATAACHLICGAPDERRLALAGELLAAVWTLEQNIADRAVLASFAAKCGVHDHESAIAAGRATYEQFTAEALARGVFGAPTYVYRNELFWGQDRLDFLDRALAGS